MKIAIIGHKRIPSNEGGIEKGVEQHAVRMAALGHEVHVYNRGGADKYSGKCERLHEYKGVRIITIPTFQNQTLNAVVYSFLATLRAAFGRYDVVSYRASGPCAMVGLAKKLGMKCVASLHGIDSQRSKWGRFASWYLRRGERLAATKADALMVLSKNMQKYISDEYGANSILFYNGVDRPKILSPNEINSRFGLEKNGYILYLSRIVPEKGLDVLIRAYKQVKTEKKLVIAGGADSSEYLAQLKLLADDDNRIHFVGYVTGNTIAELYSNAWLFTLPSYLEGMSNSLLEALSYGNCCFLSDIPENTEPAGTHACYFRTGDIEDCRHRLQELLDNPKKIRLLKSEASDYVCNRFSWDGAVDLTLNVYKSVVYGNGDMR